MSESRMHDVMRGYVERGEVPGIVALVHRGETRVDVLGAKAIGGAPMERDTIFRITSMSKPIAAAAAMILVDDGKLRIDDPVDALLPELAKCRVLRAIDAPVEDTVPAKRAITARDLLTFRMGSGQTFVPPDTYPIQRAIRALGVPSAGPPEPQVPPAPDEWIRRFATLPLMAQPGERWLYNTSAEVLSVLVARAAKQPFDVFLQERIFAPLGMKDTAFTVPASKLDRFVPAYARDPSGRLVVYDGVADSAWARPPAFPNGAGGLVSTVDDCAAFARMMLGRGALGGTRILAEATALAMTRDALTAEQRADGRDFLAGGGWGLGMAVRDGFDAEHGTPGGAGWDGGFGSSFAWDAKAGLAAVLLTQRMWDSPSPPAVYRDFWRAAYA